MSPAVSVLLPVRNAQATLDGALRSLWNQTWTDFEVVAVDDGSTDASGAVLRRHARGERRLRVLAGNARGLVPALEQARAATAAPLLARMDADDLCHPDRLSRQVRYLDAHPGVGVVGSRIRIFPRDHLGPGWRRYEVWLNRLLTPMDHARELFVESPLAHPSVMMRADAVAGVGGYRDRGWAEDYDLWHRLLRAGWDLAKVDAALLAWRNTPARLSRTHPSYHLTAFLRARAHYLARHPAFDAGRTAVWGAGKTGRRLARYLIDEGLHVVRFYDVDPAKIGRRVRVGEGVGGAAGGGAAGGGAAGAGGGAREGAGGRTGGAAWNGRRIVEVPIHSWRDLIPPSDPLVVAVASPATRGIIASEVRRRGYREGADVFFAA
jgi:glycosyltransferase involved in cell wall biosynthesis